MLDAPASATALEARHALTPAALVTPFAVVLGALVVLTARLQLGSSLDGVSLATGMTLIALVLLRQALLVLDLVRAAGTARSLQARLRTALGDAP